MKIHIQTMGEQIAIEAHDDQQKFNPLDVANVLMKCYLQIVDKIVQQHPVNCECDEVPFHQGTTVAVREFREKMHNNLHKSHDAVAGLLKGEQNE